MGVNSRCSWTLVLQGQWYCPRPKVFRSACPLGLTLGSSKNSFRMLYLSSLFVPLRAWAGTAHSPALNSDAKVRARVCNAKRFEKFFACFAKKFSDFLFATGDCKDFFAVEIVEEVKHPIKKGLRLNINN